MADIDINELQNITALADADELLAIVSGLGKNVTWAKIKELLIAQLPEATSDKKGLMSASMFSTFPKQKGLGSPSEIEKVFDTGWYYVAMSQNFHGISYGVLLVFNTGAYKVKILIDLWVSSIIYQTYTENNSPAQDWKRISVTTA